MSHPVFNVTNLRQAKEIILTPEDSTTEHRWQVETPYLADLIVRSLGIGNNTLVLDYGCGVGRIARELMARTQCRVVGVDTSPSMRALAAAYVEWPRFAAADPGLLNLFPSFDAVLAIWVLQHCEALGAAIEAIVAKMKPGASLMVVNNHRRALPASGRTWADDGVSVRGALLGHPDLRETAYGTLDPEKTTPSIARNTFWAVYQRAD